jgi:hypothetical protein
MNRTTLLGGLAATVVALGCCLPGADADSGAAPHGVFAFIGLDGTPPAALYSDPSVAGVTLQSTWAALEPAPGRFVWSGLDGRVAAAARAGRQVALDVLPGVFSPSWIYGLGAAKFSYQWTLPWGFTQCSTVSYPLPWDPTYGAAWNAFVTAFGQHYAGNPAVIVVKLTGVDGPTSELLLPYSTLGHSPPNGLECGNTPVAPASAWKAVGYRPSKVAAAWSGFVATFVASFATQQLMVQTGPWGFPPIDQNGNVIAGSNGDFILPRTLLLAASQAAGRRFAVQSDGLKANWNWARPATLPAATVLAYQLAGPASEDADCRLTGFVAPCPALPVIRAALARASTAGAEFVEIYPPDLLDPALDAAIAGFGG